MRHPLESDPGPDPPGDRLFVVPGPAVGRRTADIRRAGGVRILTSLGDDACLVRAAGVPFAVADRLAGYAEAGPRVWVRLGRRCPVLDRVRVPDGKLALIDADGTPRVLDAGDWHDATGVGPQPVAVANAVGPRSSGRRPAVALKLVPCPELVATLWHFDAPLVDVLPNLVRSLDAAILARLAAAEAGGKTLLRAGRGPVPVLVGGAPFAPDPRVPHLFLPQGTRLAPPLAVAAVRAAFAPDPGRVVWLTPTAGGFRTASVPRRAFAPLAGLVRYANPTPRRILSAAAPDLGWTLGPRLPEPDDLRPPSPPPAAPPATAFAPPAPAPPADAPSPRRTPALKAGSAGAADLGRLEAAFFEASDRPELDRWRDLADAAERAGDAAGAAHARLVVYWTSASADDLAAWQRVAAGKPHDLASRLAGASGRAADPLKLRNAFDATEAALPVRAAWLARLGLLRVGAADPLDLARCRDRLFARLRGGFDPTRDVPEFVRFAGRREGGWFRPARDWLAGDGRLTIRGWADGAPRSGPYRREPDAEPLEAFGLAADPDATLAYVDLLIAVGLGRLGRIDAGRKLAGRAKLPGRPGPRPAAGRPPRRLDDIDGPLPADWLAAAAALGERERYAVLRFRSASRLLDPAGVDPFAALFAAEVEPRSPLERTLRLAARSAERFRALWPTAKDDPVVAGRVLLAGLESVGVGELADRLPDAVDAMWSAPEWRTRLLAAALAAAGRERHRALASALARRALEAESPHLVAAALDALGRADPDGLPEAVARAAALDLDAAGRAARAAARFRVGDAANALVDLDALPPSAAVPTAEAFSAAPLGVAPAAAGRPVRPVERRPGGRGGGAVVRGGAAGGGRCGGAGGRRRGGDAAGCAGVAGRRRVGRPPADRRRPAADAGVMRTVSAPGGVSRPPPGRPAAPRTREPRPAAGAESARGEAG